MARKKTKAPRSFPIWPGMVLGAAENDGVTLDANGYSNPVQLRRGGNAAIHLDVGAGLTGTFSVQASCVPFPELATDADWVEIAAPVVIGTALAYAGSAGKTLITFSAQPYEWVRLEYTDTSGSATVRAYACTDDLA